MRCISALFVAAVALLLAAPAGALTPDQSVAKVTPCLKRVGALNVSAAGAVGGTAYYHRFVTLTWRWTKTGYGLTANVTGANRLAWGGKPSRFPTLKVRQAAERCVRAVA